MISMRWKDDMDVICLVGEVMEPLEAGGKREKDLIDSFVALSLLEG